MLDDLARLANLRDLGGHRTASGAVVRKGRIYRSATLSGLDDAALAALRALGIRTIVDLRRNAEREAHPTPWQAIGCTDYWCHDYHEIGADLGSRRRDPALTADDSRRAMIELYRDLPYAQATSYARLFGALARDEVPVLFHCAVGKDRTGVAAALILSALGVPRPAIAEDYAATARFDLLGSPHLRDRRALPADRAAALAPLFGVEAAYLDAMFDAVTARNGSIEGYMRAVLGMSGGEIASLGDKLLDQPV